MGCNCAIPYFRVYESSLYYLSFSSVFSLILSFLPFLREFLMDTSHSPCAFSCDFVKKGNSNKLRLFYNFLRLVSSTIISGGITSHVSLARSLNSFVLPAHEVDVSSAPLLGRLCALLEKIPADYRLSLSRFNLKCLENCFYL